MLSQPTEEPLKQISESLDRRATELWGMERAEALAGLIHEVAKRMLVISQDLPQLDEEPRFYI